MVKLNLLNLMGGVAVGAIALSAQAAFAQSAPVTAAAPASSASSATDASADIIVTAQRKDESLSKTPVSVSIIGADQLAKAQITSQQDLRDITPGLSVRASLNSNQLNYAIRGQTQDPLSDTAPGVLPYINEVQIGGTAGASAFYDLQSVQVLKGPQGTLFGRSATGGAVLFSTAKPTDDLSGYASVTGGDYAYFKGEGAINIPLIKDKVLFRLAGVYARENGFQYNLFTSSRTGDNDRYGFRPSLTINFTNSIHNELVVDHLHVGGSSTVAVLSGLVPYTGTGAPYIPIQFLYPGSATPTALATGIATTQAFLPPAYAAAQAAYYTAYFGPGTGHPAGGITQVLADQQARGPFVVASDANNVYRSTSTVVTNATTFDIAQDTKIKNIFGYQHTHVFNASDSDGTPFGASQSSTVGGPVAGSDELFRQVSEELQLQGKSLNSRLEYVVGGYFADQKVTRYITSTFFDILLGGQSQINDYTLKTRTFAGYGQATYQLNDAGLAATGGLRYTSERVSKIILPGDTFALANPVVPAGYSLDQSKTYNRLSWHAGLQDQVTPGTLLYASGSQAYKSGGYNGTVVPKVGNASVHGDGYDAERVIAAEAGIKFKGHLGDIPARLSTALFYNWIKNDQRLAFTGPTPASLTVNVPKGKTYGAEFEALANPIPWLTVGATGAYTKASYSADTVFVAGLAEIYDQVPDTPKFSGSLFAEVKMPVSSTLEATLHGDFYHQSQTFTIARSQDDAGAVIKGYSIANFRVGLEDSKTGWSLTGNVKNAFNRVYYVGGLATGEIFQINTLIPGAPRTFTVEARLKF